MSKCSYCDREYDTQYKADLCRDSHDLIYLQISREDLNRLHQFLFTKDESLLRDSIFRSIRKYVKP